MSELGSHKGNGIRYIMHLSAPNGGVGQMLRHPDGNWVPHENYAHLKGEVGRLRKELEESQENYHLVNELAGKEMTRLKTEVERLEHRVNYWRIEAEVDNARWLRCLQDLEELRASSFVTAVPVEEYEKLKAEVERLNDAIMRGALIPDAKPTE
jgi:predicted RNase H-like nuclease (RuvC/YqgF family)